LLALSEPNGGILKAFGTLLKGAQLEREQIGLNVAKQFAACIFQAKAKWPINIYLHLEYTYAL
jgi:hypothetical protein